MGNKSSSSINKPQKMNDNLINILNQEYLDESSLKLPKTLIFEITKYLSLKEISSLSLLNKYFFNIIYSQSNITNMIWKFRIEGDEKEIKELIENQRDLSKFEQNCNKFLLIVKYNSFHPSIMSSKEKMILIKFLKEENLLKLKVKKLYQASINGYSSSSFHKFCDNIPQTICIIKANGYIFGGYNPVIWSGQNKILRDKTFIFSLSNPSNLPIKFTSKKDVETIYDYRDWGNINY